MIFRSTRRIAVAGHVDVGRRSRDVKFAISSLVFNFIFILLKCPSVVLYLLIGNRIRIPDSFLFLSLLLFFSNSCISIFVHFISNSLFRRELFIILRLRKPQSDQSMLNSVRSQIQTKQKALVSEKIN